MTNASELFSKDGIVGYREFRASTTWSPPFRMRAIVHCIGGGGSGGSNTVSGLCTAVSGGGAGEHSGSILILDPAVTYTVTVGAGGAAAANLTTANVGNAGNGGGTSSFSGTGITTITANGGSGGAQGSASAGTGVSVSGGAGGTGGAGELFTFDGGRGGDAEVTTSGLANSGAISGGGAVGIEANGFRGGDAVYNAAVASRRVATGGGGTGGRGGDNTVTGTGSTNPDTYGGSNTMNAGDVASGFADGDPPLGREFDSNDQGSLEAIFSRGLFEALKVSTFGYSTGGIWPPGFGGLGNTNGSGRSGGAFSGGGAAARSGSSITQSEGGYPGGGGGGVAIIAFSSATLTCAPGGDGCVIIEILEILA